MIIHYHPTGAPPERLDPVETQGVSGLLEGKAEALVPLGNPRHARRIAKTSFLNGNGHHHANGNGNGNGFHGPESSS